MEKYKMTDHGTPKIASPDGNCFFNTILISLYGNESYTTELRVRTCIEMCRNGNTYPTRPNAENIAILSPSLKTSANDCAQSGAYASPWTLFAAADALGITVNSVY
jgi:hypothetical protein